MLTVPPALASDLAFVQVFLNQPIDVVLFEILLFFGWVPIASVVVWGFMEMWKDHRQDIYLGKLEYCLLAIDVPKMTEQSPMALENIFSSLQGGFSNYLWKEIWFDGKVPPRFAFEIASVDGYIQFFVRCETRYRDIVEAGVYAQYPDAQISEVEDYMKKFPSKFPNPEWDMWGSELTLKGKDDYLPFKTWPAFEHSMSQELKDPLAVMLEQLSRMRPGEAFIVQIVIELTNQKWKDEGAKYIRKVYGLKENAKSSGLLGDALSWPGEFLEHATGVNVNSMLGLGGAEKPKDEDIWRAFKITLSEKAQVEAVANKISKIGFRSKLRLVYFGRKGIYAKHMRVAMVKGMLLQYNSPGTNEFSMYGPQTPKNDYFWQRWTYSHRQTRLAQALEKRSFGLGATPKILCTEELATLWHFPTVLVKAPLIKKTESRRAEPPVSLPITSEDESVMFRPPATAIARKEAPPAFLPMAPTKEEAQLEPDIQLVKPTNVSFKKEEKPLSRPIKETVGFSTNEKKIPAHLRVLFDPGIELEDVERPLDLENNKKEEKNV